MNDLLTASERSRNNPIFEDISLRWNVDRVKYEWETAVDSLKELISLVDENMKVVRINRTIERWRETRVESILGSHLHDVLHPVCSGQDCYLSLFLINSAMKISMADLPVTEVFDSILERYLRIEMRPAYVHPRHQSQTGQRMMVFVAQDMTEFKRVENRLNQTEMELQAILCSFPDLFIYIDSMGMVLHAEGGKGVGIPLPVSGQKLGAVFSPAVAEQISEAIRAVCEKGEAKTIDFRQGIDGIEKFFEARCLPIGGGHALLIIRDITEKLRLESIAETVVTMNQIGYIFSGIRHEIGNPLNSIKMTLSVLRNNLETFDRQAVENYILRSQGELSKIEYLLKSLKNFTIYDHLELDTVKSDPFFKKFLALISEECLTRSIHLEYSNTPGSEAFIIDPRAFQQVLLNIIGNAFDALAGLSLPVLSISVSSQTGFIRVVVSDNGIGMDEEQQGHLFKPFFTNKAGGTGLGLVIAKKMMVQMNGAIQIQSVKGEGTTVQLLVPVAAKRSK